MRSTSKLIFISLFFLAVQNPEVAAAATLDTPTNVSPSGSVFDTTPTVSWSPVTGANYYRVALKQGATWIWLPEPLPSATTYTPPAADALTPGQCYTLNVRAERVIGDYGPWSAVNSFCIDQPTPDIVITGIFLTPPQPEPGDSVTVKVRFQNIGPVATPAGANISGSSFIDSSFLGIFIFLDIFGDGILSPMESYTSNAGSFIATGGNHQITANVTTSFEEDTSNNSFALNFYVEPPDPYHEQAVDVFNQQIQTQWDVISPRIEDFILDQNSEDLTIDSISAINFTQAPGVEDIATDRLLLRFPAQDVWSISLRIAYKIPFFGDTAHVNVDLSNLSIAVEASVDDSNPEEPKLAFVGTPELTYDLKWSSNNVLVWLADFLGLIDDFVEDAVQDAANDFTEQIFSSGFIGSPTPYGMGLPPLPDPGQPNNSFLLTAALTIDQNIQENHFYPSTGTGSILTAYYGLPYDGTWQQAVQLGYQPGPADESNVDNFGDSAIWTGHYLAAQAFRAASLPLDTGSKPEETKGEKNVATNTRSQALSNARRAIAGLDLLSTMRAPGLLNRAIIPIGDFMTNAQVAQQYPSLKDPYSAQYGGQWYALSDRISRDQYMGVFFGLGMAYKLVPELRAETQPVIERLLDYLIGHDWWAEHTQQVYIDANGVEGPVAASWVAHPTQELAWLQVGIMVNPSKYLAEWNAKRNLSDVVWLQPWTGTFDSVSTRYFKFNLDMGALFTYLFLDSTPSREHDNFLRTFRIVRSQLRHHRNPYFSLMEHAVDPGQVNLGEVRLSSTSSG